MTEPRSTKKRRIVTFDNLSADGYFCAADGSLDWVVDDPEVTAAAMEAAPDVDTMLFGRRTYEMFEAGWRDKDANPHGGESNEGSRQMSVWINEKEKIVFSRSLTPKDVTWKHSRLLHDLDARTIEAITREPGGDLIVFGSGTVVSRLTELGLVDEYTFVVSPVLIGTGRTLVADARTRARLALLDQRAFPRTGHVLLRYGRA